MRMLKIGLMGSSSSGKTTSANMISKRLNLYFQEEVESFLLKKWLKNGLVKSKEELTPEITRELQEESIKIRERSLRTHRRMVTDRTPLETLVYNEIYVQPHYPEDYGAKMDLWVKRIMSLYTHLFLFPYGVLSLEDNQLRTLDEGYRSKIHRLIAHKLGRVNLRYVQLSAQQLTKEERVEEILRYL